MALGMLVIGRGGWLDAVLGGVNYGRDSDSVAAMAGALAGALGGRAAVPAQLVDDVASASKVDIVAPGERLAEVTLHIRRADAERHARTSAAFEELASTP